MSASLLCPIRSACREPQSSQQVRQHLLELQRHDPPCLLPLTETIVAVKTIERIDETESVPVVRVHNTNGPPQDIPIALIESIAVPDAP